MEADRMAHLTLTEENLQNEKRIVTEELRVGTENDPMSRLLHAALKAVFGEHPYAYTAIGTKEDVAAASLDQCISFYERYYRPGNAHLVIVGPVEAGETMEAVKGTFGAIEARDAPPPVDASAVDEWDFPEEVELREDLPPVEIAALGFPVPPADSPDNWALIVLRHLISGGEVQFFADELVRRRRKAIYAETMNFEGRRGGMLVFLAGYLPYRRKATAFRLMEEALGEQARFEWLTEETLQSAKRALVLQAFNETYFASSQAGSIGRAAWWWQDERLGIDKARRIEEVTLEEVRDVYGRYIGEAEPVRLYVKPEKVPLMVRLFGWLYPLVNR
jgi:predicted Zn-dependent peptidase